MLDWQFKKALKTMTDFHGNWFNSNSSRLDRGTNGKWMGRGCMSYVKSSGEGDIYIRPPHGSSKPQYSKYAFDKFVKNIKTHHECLENLEAGYATQVTKLDGKWPAMVRYTVLLNFRTLWFCPRYVYVINYYMERDFDLYQAMWIASFSRRIWTDANINWDFTPYVNLVGGKGSLATYKNRLSGSSSAPVDSAVEAHWRGEGSTWNAPIQEQIRGNGPFNRDNLRLKDIDLMLDTKAIRTWLEKYK